MLTSYSGLIQMNRHHERFWYIEYYLVWRSLLDRGIDGCRRGSMMVPVDYHYSLAQCPISQTAVCIIVCLGGRWFFHSRRGTSRSRDSPLIYPRAHFIYLSSSCLKFFALSHLTYSTVWWASLRHSRQLYLLLIDSHGSGYYHRYYYYYAVCPNFEIL